MSDLLEPAKTSRSRCRQCRQSIDEGDFRFGSDLANFYSDSSDTIAWYHVRCASQRLPERLLPLLRKVSARALPNRDDLIAACDRSKKKSSSKYPYGERAPTARAKCIKCDQAIAKGELRVAVEREIQTGDFTTTGAGYLHPACAVVHLGDPKLGDVLRASSPLLDTKDRAALADLCDVAARTTNGRAGGRARVEKARVKPAKRGQGAELVFADQLLEKGDPRGELIIVETELDELGLDHPKGPQLAARAEKLRSKALAAWKKVLGPVRFELELGLPSRVPVQVGAPELGAVPAHEWIIGYRAHGTSEERLFDLVRHLAFARARSLVIDRDVRLSWKGLMDLCACPQVKHLERLGLDLHLGPRAVHAVLGSANLARLTHLEITCPTGPDPDIRGFDRVAGLPALRALHLKLRYSEEIVGGIVRSPLARRLEELWLWELPKTLVLPNLRRLLLSGSFIGGNVRPLLDRSSDLSKLAYLDLSSTNLTPAAAMSLADAENLPALRRLDVSGNPIGVRAVTALRRRFGDALIAANVTAPRRAPRS